jgi:hypothetical protein
VQKWLQKFGLIFFGQSELRKGFFVDFFNSELTLTTKISNQNFETTFTQ